jgi:putative ABC transport system permease protein
MWSSYPDFADWEARQHVFADLAAFSWRRYTITDLDDPLRLSGCLVTDAFDDVLGVAPCLGRAFLPDDYQPGAERVVLLGHGIWQRAYGGDRGIIGRWITIDGAHRHQIVGVMPPRFDFPCFMEIWLPLRSEESGPRTMDDCVTFGRLRAGVSIETARADILQIGNRLAEEHPENAEQGEVRVVPYGSYQSQPLRGSLLTILVIACLVLLLACSNLANLMLSRTISRKRELSVRAVLGAGRSRLIQQVLIESLVIALAGGILGIVLGRLGLHLLLNGIQRAVPTFLQFEMNGRVLASLAGIIVLTGLVFGMAPALAVRRDRLGTSLRSDALRMSPGKKYALMRSALVTFQITLATIILMVTGLVVKNSLDSRAIHLGVDTDHLLGQYLELPQWAYPTSGERYAFFHAGVARLLSRPQIEAAAYISHAPADRTDWQTSICTSETATSSERPYLSTRIRIASPGYFTTAGIPLLAGRLLRDTDMGQDQKYAIVNESLARRLWPGSDPIGRSFFRSKEPDPERAYEVVGVVGDVRHGGPGAAAGPCCYLPLSPQTTPSTGWLIVRSSGEPLSLAPVLHATIRELDPHLAKAAPQTISELARALNWRVILFARILGVIAVFAVVLALVGIFGIISYAVSHRKREFGIRLALGAGTGSITRGMIRHGAAMAGIGVVVGMVVAIAAMRFLSSMLLNADARDPAVYVLVAAFLITTTLLASYLPARRIARIDPVGVLREE